MKYFVLITLLFVAGCSSSVPTLQQYLLRADAPGQYAVQDQSNVVGIGVVSVAPYIDGLGLVLETSAGEVRAARDHQWAEPLRESLRIFFAREISSDTGRVIRAQRSGEADWQRRVDIRVDQLHGTAAGEATLVAYWSVFDVTQRTVISENGFTDSEPLGEDGYHSLVQAQKKLLSRLASAIAATL
ncbi:MAG: hypothetical protein DRQ54_05080 [Gammaproteobacteria bacterium]|nr:MAG: hypothetical protein DRQ54_05080 [Gammaproteobacteria bacterium]RLA14985.1 MAG: hypothetical protein DRQ52_02900 [Gammaproteobacteria bacterium]